MTRADSTRMTDEDSGILLRRLSREMSTLREELGEFSARHEIAKPIQSATAKDTSLSNYEQVKTGVATAVEKATFPGATVAVINKGDAALLRFSGRHGWHFPRRSDGEFIGHHPANGAAATEYLKEVRRQGANFIVIPEIYAWWLDHYSGFIQGVDCRLVHQDSFCRIFEFGPIPQIVPGHQARNQRAVQQVRDIVECTLPRDATVAVAGGDDALLDLGSRKTMHFPRVDKGNYAGDPADDSTAVAQAKTLRSFGAQYLLFPRTSSWWVENYPGLNAYLIRIGRLAIRQDNLCWIFELGDN